MKETEALVLTKWQGFWHYCIVFWLCLLPAVTTLIILVGFLTDAEQSKNANWGMIKWMYWPFLPALAFYFIQRRRLKFKMIDIRLDSEAFHHAWNETAKALKWEIIEQTSTVIVAKTPSSWKSWGELITIIKDEDKILFNSICDPNRMPSVSSWGRNKLNFKTFKRYVLTASA